MAGAKVFSSAPAVHGASLATNTTFAEDYRAIWVGTGGTLVCTLADGSVVTLKNVGSGVMLPIAIIRVDATSTATDLVGLS